jgi:hypothetical protein
MFALGDIGSVGGLRDSVKAGSPCAPVSIVCLPLTTKVWVYVAGGAPKLPGLAFLAFLNGLPSVQESFSSYLQIWGYRLHREQTGFFSSHCELRQIQ